MDDDHPILEDQPRPYAYLRPAVLVLLNEQESPADELAVRLAELGFGPTVLASLERELSGLDDQGLVTSSRAGRPPRPVYRLTERGDRHLRETAPVLRRQGRALGAMLDHYRAFGKAGVPTSPRPRPAARPGRPDPTACARPPRAGAPSW